MILFECSFSETQPVMFKIIKKIVTVINKVLSDCFIIRQYNQNTIKIILKKT